MYAIVQVSDLYGTGLWDALEDGTLLSFGQLAPCLRLAFDLNRGDFRHQLTPRYSVVPIPFHPSPCSL